MFKNRCYQNLVRNTKHFELIGLQSILENLVENLNIIETNTLACLIKS